MPVFQIGGLVKPNPGHSSYDYEDNPDAVGIIIEMRDMIHLKPEAKIIWNDIPGEPAWSSLEETVALE